MLSQATPRVVSHRTGPPDLYQEAFLLTEIVICTNLKSVLLFAVLWRPAKLGRATRSRASHRKVGHRRALFSMGPFKIFLNGLSIIKKN